MALRRCHLSLGSDAVAAGRALSWLNLRFGMRAYVQRDYREGNFFWARCPVTRSLPGKSRSAWVVPSRHPGRYPKLESPTLSYPALEPLTEHRALTTGLFNRADARSIPSGSMAMLSVCLAARRVSRNSELRTFSILPSLVPLR